MKTMIYSESRARAHPHLHAHRLAGFAPLLF